LECTITKGERSEEMLDVSRVFVVYEVGVVYLGNKRRVMMSLKDRIDRVLRDVKRVRRVNLGEIWGVW